LSCVFRMGPGICQYPPGDTLGLPRSTSISPSLKLSQRPDALSSGLLPLFLPVGINLTSWALHFLPAGKPGLQASDFQPADRTLTPAAGAWKM
jgi:hypothetical protein